MKRFAVAIFEPRRKAAQRRLGQIPAIQRRLKGRCNSLSGQEATAVGRDDDQLSILTSVSERSQLHRST